jgi:hypothetical protein
MNSTWQSREEMRRGIGLMLQGNPYFAWQHSDGSYRPCRHVEQLERFESGIFEGQNTPGFYAIRPDDCTRWGALDFDNHDGSKSHGYWLPHAQNAFDSLAGKLAERWLVESSPGGYHVIGFSETLQPAADLRRLFTEIAPAGVEAFPKQDKLSDDAKAKGSLLRFPGKHQRKGTWARLIARSGHVQDAEGVTPAAPRKSGYSEPSAEGRLWSLYHTATRGIEVTGQGQRFHALQRIVGRLKGRATEDEALWCYTAWHNRHAAAIGTPLELSRGQFLAWYRKAKPCIIEIPDAEPTPSQAALIASLPKIQNVPQDRLAAAIRVILATHQFAAGKGRADFFLSLRTIADKLGCSIGSASSYVTAARRLGIVTVIEQGHTGRATTYKLGKEWDT